MVVECWECRLRGRGSVQPEYVWTGIYGGWTLLCRSCCAEWRREGRDGCLSVMSINAWLTQGGWVAS